MNNFIKILCVSIFMIPAVQGMDHNQHTVLGERLNSAAAKGNLQTIQHLLKQKADVNYESQLGLTPLECAAANRELPCVQELIRSKAQVNYASDWSGHGITALMIACNFENNDQCVQALIAANANINQADIFGNTALKFLAARGNQNMCEVLVDELLKYPNKSQKESIIAVLSCGTKRKKGLFKKCMVPKEITQQIAKYMLEACEQANRANFTDSVAHQEIMKLAGDIKNNLLKKYSPKQSKCSIQ